MASKSKSRRRVFRASCILAALIVAGSSFAWFASKDEVANRLTATADYGTSIVEDFYPPKNMTPGENVNKDVSVVNTGNVDAFVRLALENQLEIKTYDSDPFTFGAFQDTTTPYYTIKKVTKVYGEAAADDEAALSPASNQAAYQYATTGKWGLVTTTEEELPEHYATAAARNADKGVFENSIPDVGDPNVPGSTIYTFEDGIGGTDGSIKTVTVSNPTAATLQKGVVLNESQSLNSETGVLTPNEVTTLQAGGTVVMAASKILPKSKQIIVAGDDTTPPTQIDYDGIGQYTPDGDNGNASNKKTGLYIFKRTVYEGDNNDKTEYSGYYYDEATDTFYALKTKVKTSNADKTNSTTTPYIDFGKDGSNNYLDGFTLDDDGQITGLTAGAGISLLTQTTYKTDKFADETTGVELATVTPEFGKLTVSDGNADGWVGSITGTDNINDPDKVNAVKLKIKTGADASSLVDNGTVIYIKLADDWTDHWKVVEPTGAADSVADWFYYKDTVKSGETTEKLVDYVRIDNTVNQTDFVDLIYDLNVVLESKQVVHNNEGDETAQALEGAGWATATLTDAPVDNNGVVTTIDSVDWN